MGDRRMTFVPGRRYTSEELQLAILEELILLRKDIRKMQEQIQQAFDDLNAKVANIESEEQAAETLLSGLNQQLQSALSSSNDPTEVVKAVQAVSDRLNTDAAQLAAAITANTPASSGNTGGSSSGSTTGGTTSGSGSSGSSSGADAGGSSGSSSGSTSTSGDGSGAADPTA